MRTSSIPAALLLAAGLWGQLPAGTFASAADASMSGDAARFKWVSRADALKTDLLLGYEVVYGARVREWLLLERQPDGRSNFDYIVLPPAPLSRFQDDVNAAVSKGFLLVGSSRVDLQACKLEYSIVSPK